MLTIRNLGKRYESQWALRDIDLELKEGEILVVLGPSGSGKSTLLKLVAGLEEADEGSLYWKDQDLGALPVHERDFGYMFQDYALFPHRDVAGNVAFGLEMAEMERGLIAQRVLDVLDLVGLEGFGSRRIDELSGGEQQRVALARSLAPKPQLLMLDEPLGSLDRALREELGAALRSILKSSQQSSIYVTHDQEEAFALGDRILLLNEGKLVQIGSPEELYFSPANHFAASFMGFSNLYEASTREEGGKTIADCSLGSFEIPKGKYKGPQSLLIRPEGISLGGRGKHKLKGILRGKVFRGRYWELEFDLEGERLVAEMKGEDPGIELGQTLELGIRADAIKVLPND